MAGGIPVVFVDAAVPERPPAAARQSCRTERVFMTVLDRPRPKTSIVLGLCWSRQPTRFTKPTDGRPFVPTIRPERHCRDRHRLSATAYVRVKMWEYLWCRRGLFAILSCKISAIKHLTGDPYGNRTRVFAVRGHQRPCRRGPTFGNCLSTNESSAGCAAAGQMSRIMMGGPPVPRNRCDADARLIGESDTSTRAGERDRPQLTIQGKYSQRRR